MPWWRDNNDSIYQIIHKSLLACLWCFIIGSGWVVEHSRGAWSTLIMTNNSNLRPRIMRVIELICIMCCSVNSKSVAHTHVSRRKLIISRVLSKQWELHPMWTWQDYSYFSVQYAAHQRRTLEKKWKISFNLRTSLLHAISELSEYRRKLSITFSPTSPSQLTQLAPRQRISITFQT